MHSCVCLLQGRLVFYRLNHQLSARVSTGGCAMYSQGRPPPSGERGRRERNFQCKQAKKEKTKAIDMQRLLKGIRDVDTNSENTAANLKDVLAGIKIDVEPNEAARRRRLGMPSRSSLTRPEKEVARLRRDRLAENSIYPSAGPRLGVFNLPGPDTRLMPPAPPNIAEREHAEMVDSMQCLMPTDQFELDMTDVAFPRQFPIDNEISNTDEADVRFEDHVLLNHLLKGFPSRGPVRHFMEMVVTGLSKNPHYTAQEKRDYVQWYRDYFAQFSDEELQALPPPTRNTVE